MPINALGRLVAGVNTWGTEDRLVLRPLFLCAMEKARATVITLATEKRLPPIRLQAHASGRPEKQRGLGGSQTPQAPLWE
jgi:hypothetical protein